MFTRSLVLTLSVLLCLASAVHADDDRNVSVGASISATNMDARTSWSAAGSFEYRLNRVAGFELEVTVAPRLKTDDSDPFGPFLASSPADLSLLRIFPPPTFANQRGRAVIFTNNVRLHVPSTSERLDPYFVAGGGMANVRQSADFFYGPFVYPAGTVPPGVSIPTVLPVRPITAPYTTTSTSLVLTLGGGIGVRLASQLWIEGDLRLFRLLDSEDRNVGRFGVGVRYRF